MARPNSRLKEFELQLASERRRQQSQRPMEAERYSRGPARRQRNTLGPQEDVIERRRHRNRVFVSDSPDNVSRHILMENVFLLLLLAASIYGIYRLCIYILNM